MGEKGVAQQRSISQWERKLDVSELAKDKKRPRSMGAN
jgi:hypothetical protein